MKFDKAYCVSLDEKLTIYDVRDLNFDETVPFDSDTETFQCPNDACRNAFDRSNHLTTFNARRVRFKRTPHFKNTPSTRHLADCPYLSPETAPGLLDPDQAADEVEGEQNFPVELLLSRRVYSRKPATPAAPAQAEPREVTRPAPEGTPNNAPRQTPNRTSVFAHPVECFVSNFANKELLKRMPLTIGELSLNYNAFFKRVEYCQDRSGLIYWGRIKEIKDYKSSFSVVFDKPVWADRKRYSVNVYLSKSLIENYRQRTAFLEEIKSVIDQADDLYCFFYGVTPELKQVPSKKNPEQTFSVFSCEIENLDHFLIREASALETP
ncbi:hypothetical protein [Pseudomonas vanderleydeniana]|uniref:Uncharacterized protein n=1 Tax=Pseudomonas vanderleydeniana TaxID=2745495 RepID=A0A9E6PNY9_9PSED|nr:hypothetical protein [Pseudomonas vanderleydeniana]QXI30382.1 hypothetical protein HU752_010670 [Pseudomonas vanderleydeniana]